MRSILSQVRSSYNLFKPESLGLCVFMNEKGWFPISYKQILTNYTLENHLAV